MTNTDKLMEEVKRYYSDNFDYISSDQPTLSILTNIARHFAEWQKEQDDKEQADLFTIVALDAAQRAKEQMMKDAVEGTIFCQRLNRYIYLKEIDESLHYGDKVRIIIVKE